MATPPRILALAGSTRKDSFNRRLIALAAESARKHGAEVTLVELADYPMPLVNEDLEAAEGLPEAARDLKNLFKRHQGLLIASPEYNSSITPLLKNTLDWISRREGDEAPLAAFQGKVATLISASPSGLGGIRGLVTVRSILGNIGVVVLPQQLMVSNAHKVFQADGTLSDPDLTGRLSDVTSRLVHATRQLAD